MSSRNQLRLMLLRMVYYPKIDLEMCGISTSYVYELGPLWTHKLARVRSAQSSSNFLKVTLQHICTDRSLITGMIPTLEQLVHAHAMHMGDLSQETQDINNRFINDLNIPALLKIARRALGSECTRFDKIYQGIFPDTYLCESLM